MVNLFQITSVISYLFAVNTTPLEKAICKLQALTYISCESCVFIEEKVM